MSKPMDFRVKRVRDFPNGEPFVMFSNMLLTSPSWKAASINVRRLVDFLSIEHMAHGGSENGNLKAPYNQLVEFGITRRLIRQTIDLAEMLGLIEVERGARRTYADTEPSLYTLNFFKVKCRDEVGRTFYQTPSHRYAKISLEKASEIVSDISAKKKTLGNDRKLVQFPNRHHVGS